MTFPRFDLTFVQDRWVLTRRDGRGGHTYVKAFGSKAAALKGGALFDAIGGRGAVTIRKKIGRVQRVQVYPRVMFDPRGSRG